MSKASTRQSVLCWCQSRIGKHQGYSFLSTRVVVDGAWIHLVINYYGNQGARVTHVNQCLKKIGLPSVEKLRALRPEPFESGSPDYAWTLHIKIKP